jgi:hypothetical protein
LNSQLHFLSLQRVLKWCLLLPEANGRACVNFGCTHPIDGVVLKSTHLFAGFLFEI